MSKPRQPFVLKGRHVLLAVVGFFLVVIGVDASFTVLAVKSFPGEVSHTPYEDGLAYNRTLQARAVQAKLGWTATVEADGAPGLVRVRMADAAGAPLDRLVVGGLLERPATASGERRLLFRRVGPGLYEGRAEVAKGGWDLTLSAHDAQGRSFEAERRLLWR